MVHSPSEEFQLHISDDGTAMGNISILEKSLDISVNTGKSAQRVPVKGGGAVSYQDDDGASISGAFLPQRPLATGQALLQAAHESGEPIYAELKGARTGDRSYAGLWIVVITTHESAAKGRDQVSFELSIDGDVTYGAVA